MEESARASEKAEKKTPQRKRKRTRRLLIVLGILLAIRLALPYVILYYANKKLATLDGYYGHVDDIDLAIIRGAYTIDDIYINKVDEKGNVLTEFFSSPEIDLSVEWRAIFEGKIVAEVEFESPILNYTMGANVGDKAPKDSTSFIELVKDFVPLDINRCAANNGQVHYRDESSSPPVDVPLTEMQLEGRGLTNKPAEGVVLPATIDMSATLYDGGMEIGVKLDPLNKVPTFDLDAKLTKTQLTHLNPLFTAYANFDLKAGTMELASEFAAKEGEFTGYVKPVIKDLDIVQLNKEEGSLPQIAWEAIVGTVAEVFQNQRKDQLATKVDINGKFTQPDVDIIDAIISLLKNAFVRALEPSIENTINLKAVDEGGDEKGGFFHKLFGKDEKTQVEEDNDDDKNSKREERKEARKEKREKRKEEEKK
jgi:hypothetical protein